MQHWSKKWREVGITIAIIITALAATWILLTRMGIFPWSNGTISITEKHISDLSGYDYDVIYTNVDNLAKSEYISVYVSKSKIVRAQSSLHSIEKKTLIFRYDPALSDTLPVIVSTGTNRIKISIPRVAQVFVQLRQLGDLSIYYDIGHIDYPDTNRRIE
jgi:hypothetical protein